MIRDLFRRRARDADAAARLKALVREVLNLGEEEPVILAELRCHDPGCPEVETAISVTLANGRRVTLRPPRALADVGRDDLEVQLALLTALDAVAPDRQPVAP